MGKKKKKRKNKNELWKYNSILINLFYFFFEINRKLFFDLDFQQNYFFVDKFHFIFSQIKSINIGLECEINRNECLISFLKILYFFLIFFFFFFRPYVLPEFFCF